MAHRFGLVQLIKNTRAAGVILWDLFMVWVAIINLSLILFDFGYLWIRPHLIEPLPVISRVYDPVVGIRPHPTAERLIDEASTAEKLLRLDPDSPGLQNRLTDLAQLTSEFLRDRSTVPAGRERAQIIIARILAEETNSSSEPPLTAQAATTLADRFWLVRSDLLRHRFTLFSEAIEPLLDRCYLRTYDRKGRLVDHFWIIDLPFLLLFWVEFMVRWTMALRRRIHARWFFFPIFNWYDVLGLIPIHVFRPFRLLRAVSIYMRLRRSELSSVGRDFASRTVAYFSNIITEEVSDRVAIRILEEYAEEIRDGTHLRIIEETMGPRRRELEGILAEHIRLLLINESTLETFRQLLRLNLERAVESSERLRSVPVPQALLRPMVTTIGEVLLDSTLETIEATLNSDEGAERLRAVTASMTESVLESPALGETIALSELIALQIIEHMKATVAVRKWAQSADEIAERKRAPRDGGLEEASE